MEGHQGNCQNAEQLETTCNQQETTWNDLQRLETAYNKQETSWNPKRPTASNFWDYCTIILRFPPNIRAPNGKKLLKDNRQRDF